MHNCRGAAKKRQKRQNKKKQKVLFFSSTFTCFNLTHSNCALSVWRRRTTKLRAFNCKLSCYSCYYLAVFVFCCTDWVGLYNTCSMTRIIYQTHSTNCREHFSECLYVCVHTTVIAKICLTSVNSYPFLYALLVNLLSKFFNLCQYFSVIFRDMHVKESLFKWFLYMHVLGVLVHMGPLGFMRHCSLAVRETKIPNHIYIATVSLFFSSEHCISGSLHTYLVKQEHLKPKNHQSSSMTCIQCFYLGHGTLKRLLCWHAN